MICPFCYSDQVTPLPANAKKDYECRSCRRTWIRLPRR